MLRISKAEAQYEPIAKGPDKCDDCKHLMSLMGHRTVCEEVYGTISPRGWCKLFDRKSRLAEAMKHG